ncbi:hypothetical protein B0T14DRAFT_538600 [Immersiella caudata]|uniref:Calcineurin-like phosphoesterase domain-containing protein n=1 Tax=Immersiella caudata TaxID=314043 RepID=A0AA39WK22_9PEZI|nr:hypothetical protein B0T14DRAFT_538600 [Immersiella caudata]
MGRTNGLDDLLFGSFRTVSVVYISDTHNTQPELPDGDILIHAGDLTDGGTLSELQATLDWLRSQLHRHKIAIAGNPRPASQQNAERAQLEWGDTVYLQDSSTTVVCSNWGQLKIYGSPRTPKMGNWAFQCPRGQDLWENTIPDDIDVLVTHGPPRAHLDLFNIGCDDLLREVWRFRPRLHVLLDTCMAVYERAVMQRGGLVNSALACWRFVLGAFGRPGTLLVNAAIVGGLRDTGLREPIKVYI